MTQNQTIDPLPNFSALLREALSADLDPAATTFLAMLAPDAVMEFPYAPPGGTRRLESREAVAGYVGGLMGVFTIESMTLSAIHRTAQAGVVIVEFEGRGVGVQDGKSYDQTYISVITLRDGHIAHYRDYWNPLVVLEMMEGAK